MSKIEVTKYPQQVLVSISDEVTDETTFPTLQLEADKKLVLHFKGVSYINSAGVRNWLRWIGEIDGKFPTTTVAICFLPAIFVRHFAQIQNFLPKKRKIESFIVPYYCETCGISTELAIEAASLKGPPEMLKKISTMICPDCGAKAEIDGVLEHYEKLL